jgi:ABC-type dipeptide/oligopeptide/nickel transport system ATPase component
MSHRVVVLYRGQVVEQGPADQVYERPSHPYTTALIAAELPSDPRARSRGRVGSTLTSLDPGGSR